MGKARKVVRKDEGMLIGVARTIGSTLSNLAARTERMSEKSQTIGKRARSVARQRRKRT